jgi:TolB-like protein/predicted Zn-dependent protease
VLEGSVRKAEERLRITVQLIDALKGHHLWSESYDRKLKDIFELQDEITMKIVTAMRVKLTAGEQARTFGKGTQNLKAYLKHLEAYGLYWRLKKEDNVRAKQLLEEAIALDPEYAVAYALLGFCHTHDFLYGWSKSGPKSMQRAFEIAQKAQALDDSLPQPHRIKGIIYVYQKKHEEAIAEAQQAVEIYPNDPMTIWFLGWILRVAGRPEEAIPLMEKSIRLNPIPTDSALDTLGRAYFLAEKYEKAIAAYKTAVKLDPDHRDAHIGLAATYAMLGKEEEARSEVSEILRIEPSFTIKKYEKFMFFQLGLEPEIEGLRKAGLPEHPPLKLPDKPSIAVLPFNNLSKDPDQEYFADGMTDDLITDLSKISGLFVIARNSAFQYKGKAVDVKEVSRELGIRYVLEGSVRKAGDKVRINAQLIDATTGGHLWAERYDGLMDDIFSLQDKITQKIVTALAVRLTSGEKENIASKGTNNIEAYDAFMRGWQHYLRWTPKDVAAAIQYFNKAIELDSKYYHAYAALALIYDGGAGNGREWTKALQAGYFAGRAKARLYLDIAMKKPTALAYRVASWMDLRRRLHDKALRKINKAVAISPNDAEVQLAMAQILVYTGKPKEALEVIKKVMLLDPNRMADCLYLSGKAHFCMEQYEESISSLKRASKYNPHLWVEQWLAINFVYLGRQKEAEIEFKRHEDRVLQAVQGTSIGTATKIDLQPGVYNNPFKDSEVTKRRVDGLIKAGHPKPHRYYEVSKDNKLNGNEIRELVFERTIISPVFAGGSWTMKTGKDGSAIYEGYGMKDSGRNWIEGDQFCSKFKKYLAGLKSCGDLYLNPKGILERRDEYLLVADQGIFPISFIE